METTAGTQRPMRLKKEALEAKISRMLEDPLILVRPETESVRRYKTHSRLVKQVRHELLRRKQAEGEDVHRFVREEKETRSLYRTLARAAEKFRGILQKIVIDDNNTTTADRYGIRRQRVHQIRKAMQRFAELEGVPFNKVWVQFDNDV